MLKLDNISFSYGAAAKVIDGMSLEVAPKERVAIVAPSGTGKTTFMKIAAGYLKPQAGCVSVDGKPLPRRGACPVQMIWQHPDQALDPRMRMKDSLLEAGPIDANLVDALGIQGQWMTRYPHELSGGQLQRFCIARALAAKPRYLIADEISAMLDAVTQAQLWSFLIDECARREMGMLLSSHSAALLDRVATRTVELPGR